MSDRECQIPSSCLSVTLGESSRESDSICDICTCKKIKINSTCHVVSSVCLVRNVFHFYFFRQIIMSRVDRTFDKITRIFAIRQAQSCSSVFSIKRTGASITCVIELIHSECKLSTWSVSINWSTRFSDISALEIANHRDITRRTWFISTRNGWHYSNDSSDKTCRLKEKALHVWNRLNWIIREKIKLVRFASSSRFQKNRNHEWIQRTLMIFRMIWDLVFCLQFSRWVSDYFNLSRHKKTTLQIDKIRRERSIEDIIFDLEQIMTIMHSWNLICLHFWNQNCVIGPIVSAKKKSHFKILWSIFAGMLFHCLRLVLLFFFSND